MRRIVLIVACAGTCIAANRVLAAPPERVFSDSFERFDPANPELPLGWSHWQSTNDTGIPAYDRQEGRRGAGSLCLIDSRRAVWLQKLSVTPGATYRLSGWVKVEKKSKGHVALGLIPKAVSATTGKEIILRAHRVRNEVRPSPGEWTFLEVFWTGPASGEYAEGKFSCLDIEFFGSNLKGRAWCDDVALDRIVIEGPFSDNFKNKATALDAWRIYSLRGLEGQARVTHDTKGFADAGGLCVEHIRGTPGFSAATVLDRERFGEERQWTLLAHARPFEKGKPSLDVEQLDAAGKIIQQRAEDPGEATDWAEHRVTFSLLPQTREVRLRLTNRGSGSVLFDNVWLRPAMESEAAGAGTKHVVRVGISPADVIAAIDETPPVITVPAGQTTAFNIHLAGENRPDQTTIVDVEMPEWLELRTAQLATYGKAPLAWEKVAAREGRAVYRFRDPYPWQRRMMRGNYNPYTGLLLVVRANAKAGREGEIVVRTRLGKDEGQQRKLKLVVRDPIRPTPGPREFHVGAWSLMWLNVRDDAARKELLQTYRDAGVTIGAMHTSHCFAINTFKQLDFKPTKIVPGPSSPRSYKWLPAAERPDMAVLADGKKSSHCVALGLALNDPKVHAQYKKHLTKILRCLPDSSPYVVLDIEFWGEGGTNRSCFHPSTIAAFRKRAGIPHSVELTCEVILKQYHRQWSDFRNRVTAKLHGLTRRLIREIRPDLLLLAYDYSLAPGGNAPAFVENSPMNTLLYDPHVDVHLISYYNREGATFLDAVDNDVAHLKKPVWAVPFLMKNINNVHRRDYSYNQISAAEVRFEIVGAAASGARGHLGFPGKLLDADYLHAFAEGVAAVARYESFYMDGKRADKKVTLISPDLNVRHRVHELQGKLLLTLFNCGEKNRDIVFQFNGKQQTVSVKAHDFEQMEIAAK